MWELTGAGGPERERRALRLIRAAFFGLAIYIAAQGAYVFATGARPEHSRLGIVWTAVTCNVKPDPAPSPQSPALTTLSVFGVIALSFMMLMYWLEDRGPAVVLWFALGCLLSSIHGFLSGAWPFGGVKAV